MAERLLEANGITVTYPMTSRTVEAVRSVDIHVTEGEIVGVVGGSGSGKSSLALALLRLARAPGQIVGGTCKFGSQDLYTLSERELAAIRGRDIGLVVQDPRRALNPMLSIGAQIVDVYRAHRKVDKPAARERAVEMLRLVGINDPQRRMRAFPHELSGGMAQRAVIAMALVCEPRLLIADEPTSGLDVTIQAQILNDLARSVATTGSSVLLITQDLGIVANYCDRVVVMEGGEVVEEAPTNAFFADPKHPAARKLVRTQQEEAPATASEGIDAGSDRVGAAAPVEGGVRDG